MQFARILLAIQPFPRGRNNFRFRSYVPCTFDQNFITRASSSRPSARLHSFNMHDNANLLMRLAQLGLLLIARIFHGPLHNSAQSLFRVRRSGAPTQLFLRWPTIEPGSFRQIFRTTMKTEDSVQKHLVTGKTKEKERVGRSRV